MLLNYDFSKAFDSIFHTVLLNKLKLLEFPLGFVNLISSYLTNRYQCVKIGSVLSDPLPVTSGAPQGSLLGPFLFILYCYDIKPLFQDTSLVMYADDVSEVCPIYKSSVQSSIETINSEFFNISDWAEMNCLKLNVSKTKAICIKKKNCVIFFPFPFLVTHECKLLGVIWNENLNWNSHFYNVLKVCSRRLYLLRVLKEILKHDDLWLIFDTINVS